MANIAASLSPDQRVVLANWFDSLPETIPDIPSGPVTQGETIAFGGKPGYGRSCLRELAWSW